jgi:cellobiose epimerase
MEQELKQFSEELHEELARILRYWQTNTIDETYGGFFGQIDHFNRVVPKAGKGSVLNARILWTFSAAYNFTKNETYLHTAQRSFDYLKKHFLDHENGGIIWEVDHSGKALNTRKQTYAQGFGIYGFSEYFRASGDQESLEMAIGLYENIEKYCFDTRFGGYLEALSCDWQPMEDMRLSAKDENYPKSMNTHLHILEPYTNLYRVWKNDHLAAQIKRLIRDFLDHFIDPITGHFNLFFENDWTVRSEVVSYGHDIEGAWLLTEAAEVLGDPELLIEVKSVALRMTDITIAEGMAGDGSLYYEKAGKDGHLDTDRHWWPQAEALIGLLNAWQISGDEKYLQKSMDVWHFIKNKMIDHKHGEWYWSVDNNGVPATDKDKAGFWKCPYHNSRACMEAIRRL